MSAKKMGLGRNFESLIPSELLDESFDPTAEQDENVSDLRHIKLADIVPDPDQPRRSFDELLLEELAASIREHGVLQPIVVVPHNDGYMIVAGERRFRAAGPGREDRNDRGNQPLPAHGTAGRGARRAVRHGDTIGNVIPAKRVARRAGTQGPTHRRSPLGPGSTSSPGMTRLLLLQPMPRVLVPAMTTPPR